MEPPERQRVVPRSLAQFERALSKESPDITLGDINDFVKRPTSLRHVRLDGKKRSKNIALSGSTAYMGDALFLRPLLKLSSSKIDWKLLIQYGYISDASLRAAEFELSCNIDRQTLNYRLHCPGEEDLPFHSDQGKRPKPLVFSDPRRAVPHLRDLDDFVECLSPFKVRGSSEIFKRRDSGVFFAAAKMFETYKSFRGTSATPDFVPPTETWVSSALKTPDRSTTQGIYNTMGLHTNFAGVTEQTPRQGSRVPLQFDMLPADDDDIPKDGTLTGRPDEERETNFVTAWFNALSNYHDETRSFCTLVPDRIGFDLKLDPTATLGASSKKGLTKTQVNALKLFNARSDAMVLKRTSVPAPDPIPTKVAPSSILFTAEFKPPSNSSKPEGDPISNYMPQIVLELAARISALHGPCPSEGTEEKFDKKSIMMIVVCGFQFVIILAEYTPQWLAYIRNGSARVWSNNLQENDFLRLQRLVEFDLSHDYTKMHVLNVLILAMFIQEYHYNYHSADNSDQPGPSSERSLPHRKPPQTPVKDEKEDQNDQRGDSPESDSSESLGELQRGEDKNASTEHKRKPSTTITAPSDRRGHGVDREMAHNPASDARDDGERRREHPSHHEEEPHPPHHSHDRDRERERVHPTDRGSRRVRESETERERERRRERERERERERRRHGRR